MQGERTYLAWQRTGLAFAATGALFLHITAGTSRLTYTPGLFGLAVAAVMLTGGLLRYRTTDSAARGNRHPAHPAPIILTSFAAALLAIGGLVLVINPAA